jgi:cysteine-rich repeat protein
MRRAARSLLIVLTFTTPAPLLATFHEMKIVQVYLGSIASPDSGYVMLQMWAPGQNHVGGHSVTVYNADGTLAGTATFPADLANGADQATILIGTAETTAFFGIPMDLEFGTVHIIGKGLKVCWGGDGSIGTPDCMAAGLYTGSAGNGLQGVGTPFPFLPPGLAMTRRLDICGGATTLDFCDDTDDSKNDFVLGPPTPKNNAGQVGTLPASTCGNHVIEGLEECDDGNTTSGDGCSSKCQLEIPSSDASPVALAVDPSAGASSDGNGVLEPGESVTVKPSWKNNTSMSGQATFGATAFTGPGSVTDYLIDHGIADYGIVGAEATAQCVECYQLRLLTPTSRPEARPATHWDATFDDLFPGIGRKTWTLHVGDSFTDVPRSQPFYKKIETLLHNNITAGCTSTTYCPGDPVARSQMAIFIAKGIAGGGPNVPVSGMLNGQPYNCVSGGVSRFTDVLPTDIFCKHVHYIAVQNVTLGCATGQYCPTDTVTRLQMASFIAKAVVAPQGGPGVPTTYGPDPVTGLSYSCDTGAPNIHFTDVPATDTFCKHVHFLWAKGIIAGCAATAYCPADAVTRDAMAKFLSNAFQLLLYGP